ncbi:hypothetical protein CRENBAI_024515 [Crenichthys baileyi]|uniref:Uncharacterized protein n=1 Tax=Crenichthys baileyi TaxID=28760 RepID=A0AAV9RX23_9TELE
MQPDQIFRNQRVGIPAAQTGGLILLEEDVRKFWLSDWTLSGTMFRKQTDRGPISIRQGHLLPLVHRSVVQF